jgi:hypothetical protein
VSKIPFDRLELIIKATIKDLEKRKDKAMVRTDTDNLWTKIESLQWVLFVDGNSSERKCIFYLDT